MHTPISVLLREKGNTIISATPSMTVYETAQRLNENKIGALLVMDGTKLVGIFSERDVLTKGVGRDIDLKATTLDVVMSRDVHTITPETTVQEAMGLMTERRHRHLPVMDGETVVGVVSIGDLTRWVVEAQANHIEQLQDYIQS